MRARFVAFLSLVTALGPGCPSRGESQGDGKKDGKVAIRVEGNGDRVERASEVRGADRRLAPITSREAKSTHGPFAAGACETCHERSDPANPGSALRSSNATCVGCHEEFAPGTPVRLDRSIHPVDGGPCTSCHNPHNARKPKLQM